MTGEPVPGTIDPYLRKASFTFSVAAVGAVLAGLTGVLVFLLLGDQVRWLLANQFWFSLILMFAVFQMIMGGTAICILAERKISAYIQDRHGPNRVGYLGLFQPVADGLKFFLKGDIIPKNVDKPLFILAPAMALLIALLGFIIIPWTGQIQWPWMANGEFVKGQVVDINIGFLYLLAVSSMGVYGIVLAGYASNNKYSFYGGMRATAQMLSYEVPLGLGLLAVLLVAGDLRLDHIVTQQAQSGVWNVLLHPIVFILVLVAAFAETNRLPFDLAECEQELVGGFHTEYSSMKFSMFFLGEYCHITTNCALLVALFFGGYAPLPFTSWLTSDGPVPWWMGLIQFGVFWGKVAVFIVFFMVIRWTIPRFRYDQLMSLAWQGMIPLAIVMVVVTGAMVAFGVASKWWVTIPVNVAVLVVVLILAGRNKRPVTGRQAHLPDVEVTPL